MRVNTASFYPTLEKIQDAALEPSLWASTVESISQAAGALGVNIMEPKEGNALGGVMVTESLYGVMEAYLDEEWYTRDFRAQFRPLIRRLGVVLEKDFASQDLFNELDYYKFMAKHHMRHTVMMDFSYGHDELYFVLQKDIAHGSFHPDDMPHFQALRARLKAAAQIMRHVSGTKITGMAAAFDMASIACIFFDRKGLVTLTNQKAERLLGDDLKISRGEVRALSPKDTALFYQRLKQTIQNDASSSAQPSIVALPRIGKRPLIVRFERLGGRLTDMFPHSCAMAMIEDPGEEIPPQPDTLAALFDLTPAEARISLLVARGQGAVEIAAQCGVGYETVRSHIRSIFNKTETSRQSELSALFGRIRL